MHAVSYANFAARSRAVIIILLYCALAYLRLSFPTHHKCMQLQIMRKLKQTTNASAVGLQVEVLNASFTAMLIAQLHRMYTVACVELVQSTCTERT